MKGFRIITCLPLGADQYGLVLSSGDMDATARVLARVNALQVRMVAGDGLATEIVAANWLEGQGRLDVLAACSRVSGDAHFRSVFEGLVAP